MSVMANSGSGRTALLREFLPVVRDSIWLGCRRIVRGRGRSLGRVSEI